ncbi:hypothetical protein C8F04DRAFT_1190993 [Mycena alexandri]|uniref:CxC2-like cysteine cluster KDZ transposase-associated domain-containing protein n=1 Tax=Mycena alexandri TaxID=1745969 RepID=A0AAD6WSX0_9AGAR|nr:hypothetical protein C8F04DRAFT_1190993 [Mycena alexandri]
MARGSHKRAEATASGAQSTSVGTSSHSFLFSLGNADAETRPEDTPVAAFVHRVSDDNRRVYVTEHNVEPPSPLKKMRLDQAQATSALDPSEPTMDIDPFTEFSSFTLNDKCYELRLGDDDESQRPAPPATTTEPSPRRVKPADVSLDNWRLHKRDVYLSTLVRAHGPADASLAVCPGCQGLSKLRPQFRCRDCFGGVIYCKECVVKRHAENPLHCLEMGHSPHSPCTAPDPGAKEFVVLHPNGIHEVAVDFCGCEGALKAGPREIQRLRAGWYPATHERPQTCATVVLLESFHTDTLQCKTTLYDGAPQAWGARDSVFAVRRGGNGARGARSWCPRPGVNLPEGWEKASVGERFLYTLFIALDACFRLKRRLVSNELRDPDLGSGWAYMVDTGPYREYLRGVTDQKDMDSCSGLAALDYANTKFSRGYSTTGVGMGVCGRHEFVQPNGVGDLQKGERWKVSVLDRLTKLPANVRLFLVGILMRFAIPKMHIHSHTLACQLLYSLNLLLGCAQLEGEGIERAWSSLGAVAACTRDAGPGSRHDMVDAQIAGWNWAKLVSFGGSLIIRRLLRDLRANAVELLRKRLDRATEELAEQTAAFEEFSLQQADRVPKWRQEVLDFELDGEKPNPYEIVVKGLTEAEVQRNFSKQEEQDAKDGLPAVHDVGPSEFISSGLDLEAEQRRVRVQVELKRALTADMEIDRGAQRKKLNGGIARFRKIQQSYMPAAVQALREMNIQASMLAEDVPLLLPSALAQAQRDRCVAGLAPIESLMRNAQCRTALVRLRNQLHIKSRLLLYKKGHARHQGANTRSRTIVTRNETKVRLHSEKYQTAWEALRLLNGGDASMVGWRVLRREHIRCMADTEDLRKKVKRMKSNAMRRRKQIEELRGTGILPAEEDEDMDWEDEDDGPVERGPENQRQVSWIWSAAGVEGTDAGLEKALRVEWCKAFARTRRWDEEVRLIREEYRRVGVTLEYEACKWDARAAAVPKEGLDAAEAEGAIAYALRQAEMYRDLKARGEKVWTAPKLARGKKGARHVPRAVRAMLLEVNGDQTVEGDEGDAREHVEEAEVDVVDRGDVEEDEEFIMGGEAYD